MDSEQIKAINAEPEKIDLTLIIDDMWRGVKKLWLICFIIILACAGLMGYRTKKSYVPKYNAYATFVVKTYSVYENDNNSSYYNAQTAKQLAETFPYILNSRMLKKKVEETMGDSLAYDTITAKAADGDTALFTINVYSGNPERAYKILQIVIEDYPSIAEYVLGATELAIMDESGVPNAPYNQRNLKESVMKGGLIGVILSIALLVLYAISRKTVRRPDDLKKYTSMKNLGSIPQMKLKTRSKKDNKKILFEGLNSNDAFDESLSGIRNRLMKEASQIGAKTIIITSAVESEGKTTAAANLAIAIAKRGKSVALVDGNLHKPALTEYFGLSEEDCMLEYLLGEFAARYDQNKTKESKSKENLNQKNKEWANEDQASRYQDHNILRRHRFFQYKNQPLYVIGIKDQNSIGKDLTKETIIRSLFDELKYFFEYVIIDTSACTTMADSAVFAAAADSAVLVMKQDTASLPQILQSTEIFTDHDIPILGFIMNQANMGITSHAYGYGSGYGYGYGYGYGSSYSYGVNKERKYDRDARYKRYARGAGEGKQGKKQYSITRYSSFDGTDYGVDSSRQSTGEESVDRENTSKLPVVHEKAGMMPGWMTEDIQD